MISEIMSLDLASARAICALDRDMASCVMDAKGCPNAWKSYLMDALVDAPLSPAPGRQTARIDACNTVTMLGDTAHQPIEPCRRIWDL